jgi:hypothetical protein
MAGVSPKCGNLNSNRRGRSAFNGQWRRGWDWPLGRLNCSCPKARRSWSRAHFDSRRSCQVGVADQVPDGCAQPCRSCAATARQLSATQEAQQQICITDHGVMSVIQRSMHFYRRIVGGFAAPRRGNRVPGTASPSSRIDHGGCMLKLRRREIGRFPAKHVDRGPSLDRSRIPPVLEDCPRSPQGGCQSPRRSVHKGTASPCTQTARLGPGSRSTVSSR